MLPVAEDDEAEKLGTEVCDDCEARKLPRFDRVTKRMRGIGLMLFMEILTYSLIQSTAFIISLPQNDGYSYWPSMLLTNNPAVAAGLLWLIGIIGVPRWWWCPVTKRPLSFTKNFGISLTFLKRKKEGNNYDKSRYSYEQLHSSFFHGFLPFVCV